MANNETAMIGTINQPPYDEPFESDMFASIRARFTDLQVGERLPYDAHETSIAQKIEDEMLRFAQAPDHDAARTRYEAALISMRSIPGRKVFVKELDSTLYREALKTLADPTIPESIKSAIVKASINVGIGGEKSPEIVTVYDKLQRLQKDYMVTKNPQERAAMEAYLLHITGDSAKVNAFFAKTNNKVGNVRFLSPKRAITAASLVGAISLTIAASPAAAQDHNGSATSAEQPRISISVNTTSDKQTVPTVAVAVEEVPITVPAGATIKAQTGPNQAATLPTVNVAVSAPATIELKDAAPISAQTTQQPAATPMLTVSPATTENTPGVGTQNSAPNIPAQVSPTTPSAPEVVPVTPSTSAPATPSSPNTPATPDVSNGSSTPATPDVASSPNTPATSDTPPVIQAQTPDTSVTPKDGETPAATIARIIQGHDASKAVYVIRATYGSAGNHQAAPNVQLATIVDAYVSDTQAKILAANHSDISYTNGAMTALAYLDAAANDPTILDANRTVAKDAQTAIAAFATTGEPYHDKLLAQEVAAAKQNFSSDAAGKFAGISEADQNTIAQLAGYASLATKTDAEQNAEIQKIKDDEAAAAKAAADAAAKAAADKAAADEAARRAAAAATSTPEGQAIQEIINNAGTDADKRTYTAFQYFMNNGFTAEQAAGIVGNLLVESAGTMDPAIKQGGGGPGRGIAQWGSWLTDPQGNKIVAGRFSLLNDFAQTQGKNWDDLGVQLDFIMHEFQTTQDKAFTEVKAAQNIQDAAYAFMRWYEAPKDHSPAAGSVRMNRGLPYLNIFTANVNRINQERAAAAQKAIDDAAAAAKAAADAAAQKAADEAAQALKSGDIRPTLADGLQIAANLKAEYGGVSGKLKPSELASQPGLTKDGAPYTVQLNPEAMKGYVALAAAFKAHFGYDIRLTYSYRTLAEQESLAHSEPSLAAKPGTSNHGWGLAIDLASNINNANSEQSAWMRANAYKYGWVHPTWAHDGTPKGGADEPWHWEFLGSQATFDVSQ